MSAIYQNHVIFKSDLILTLTLKDTVFDYLLCTPFQFSSFSPHSIWSLMKQQVCPSSLIKCLVFLNTVPQLWEENPPHLPHDPLLGLIAFLLHNFLLTYSANIPFQRCQSRDIDCASLIKRLEGLWEMKLQPTSGRGLGFTT